MRKKKENIIDFLTNPDHLRSEKEITLHKWQFNQLPKGYRKDHAQRALAEIEAMRSENYDSKGMLLLSIPNGKNVHLTGTKATVFLQSARPLGFNPITGRCNLCNGSSLWGRSKRYYALNAQGRTTHHLVCETCHPFASEESVRLFVNTNLLLEAEPH